MKILPFAACCAGAALAATRLGAQEPTPTPPPATTDTRAQSEQILANPLVQQFLRVVVQKALDLQPQVEAGVKNGDLTETISSLMSSLTDASGANPLAGGLPGTLTTGDGHAVETPSSSRRSGFAAYRDARLASEPGDRRFDAASRTWVTQPWNDAERARRQKLYVEDYSRLSSAERASWEASGDPMAHAWDGSVPGAHLSGGGGLGASGGLRTGTLQTGTLSTGRVTSGSHTNLTLPPRDFVTPATALAVNAPPADPDAELRRWSRQIDGQYASEQIARSAAMQVYPDLGVANSAFNAQFLARYAQYRQADPFGFLRGPGWPMKLAIFTDGDLQRQKSGSALAP